MQPTEIIVITGASSGLGAALAQAYARNGTTLGLLGRDEARLNAVAQACRAKGSTVETGSVDVCDAHAMEHWLATFNATHPIDLLIANAGISAGSGKGGESPQQVRDIFAVNVDGVLNTVLPALTLMRARGKGQIAIMSSIAGIRGLPTAPAYSASKNAVRAFGEALRVAVKTQGIRVSVICPGFIHTPMTAVNSFRMPFIMSAEKAAEIIVKGLEGNRPRIAFPLRLYWVMLLLSTLPLRISDMFFAALPEKSSMQKT